MNPRYAVIFIEQNKIIPSYIIAKRLKIEHRQIIRAFNLWGENDYPQEFFYKTNEGELSNGGTYDIGLIIWNYQGGHSYDKDIPYHFGVLIKARSWGLVPATGKISYRSLREFSREHYYLEALA